MDSQTDRKRSRMQWTHDVEETTLATRKRAARRHLKRASAAHRAGRMMTRQWHQTRAQGHMERFERLNGCGTGAVVTMCRDCGAEAGVVGAHCRAPLVCIHCRIDYQARYRDRTRLAILRALRLAKASGRTFRGASPKLLTLTVAHHSPQLDSQLLAKAWPRFITLLAAHLNLDRGWEKSIARPLYIRRLEATPSDGGHFHLHAWLHMPYVPRPVLAHLWGRAQVDAGVPGVRVRIVPLEDALEDATGPLARSQIEAVAVTRRGRHGRPLVVLYAPVVDIRKVKADDAEAMAKELAKYLLKDIDDDGNLIDPITFGDLFEGFLGRRTISGSRNLFAPEDPEEEVPPHCACCGSMSQTRRYDHTREVPRGPPGATPP